MKKILAQIKQYKKDTFLTPFYAMLEVVMEVLLPYIMAKIIDDGIGKNNMKIVGIYGGAMLAAAVVSLLSGITRGDIEVYADVTGLGIGAHEIQLAVSIGGEAIPSDLQCQFVSAAAVSVTITE